MPEKLRSRRIGLRVQDQSGDAGGRGGAAGRRADASDLGALAKLVEAFVALARKAEAERQSGGFAELFPGLGRL